MDTISARRCVHWGRLFAIDPGAMRVALGRLVKSGLLRSVRRGQYAIGQRGLVLSQKARSWIFAEQRIGPWDGRWLLVHSAHLGRRDKRALRAGEQSLMLEGFAMLHPGLWCRPANYREAPSATRARLQALGLDCKAVLSRADCLLSSSAAPEELWPQIQLETQYRKFTCEMQASMRRAGKGALDAMARETFLLGEAVIRQINSDPLLPESMIDYKARRKMHETMVAYDALGREVWTRFQNTPLNKAP
jgi:phenylacetic acid degradation operon negative regulatory protein